MGRGATEPERRSQRAAHCNGKEAAKTSKTQSGLDAAKHMYTHTLTSLCSKLTHLEVILAYEGGDLTGVLSDALPIVPELSNTLSLCRPGQ